VACDAVVKPFPIEIAAESVVSRVQRSGVKWSSDPIKNREVLDNAPKLTGILSDLSERVTKLTGTSDNIIHTETMKVALKYMKYSTNTALEESIACRRRPLVTECYVEKSMNASRKLATTLIMYDYDVLMESINATDIAHAAAGEVNDVEMVHGLNLTVTSDQVLLASADESEKVEFDGLSDHAFNITDDEIFAFDSAASHDVYLVDEPIYSYPGDSTGMMALAPPPYAPAPGADTLSPYWFAGIGGMLAMFAGVAGYMYKRSRKPQLRRDILLPEVQQQFDTSQSPMLFSQNPLHQ